MKTLRDTATLVVLLLLALTVRVDSRDPSAIDLVTPAHAATAALPVWELQPELQPQTELEAVIETVQTLLRPAELERVSLALPGVVAIPQEEGQLVWKVDDERVVSFSVGAAGLRIHVLDAAEPIDPPSPSKASPAAAPAPCGVYRARISC